MGWYPCFLASNFVDSPCSSKHCSSCSNVWASPGDLVKMLWFLQFGGNPQNSESLTRSLLRCRPPEPVPLSKGHKGNLILHQFFLANKKYHKVIIFFIGNTLKIIGLDVCDIVLSVFHAFSQKSLPTFTNGATAARRQCTTFLLRGRFGFKFHKFVSRPHFHVVHKGHLPVPSAASLLIDKCLAHWALHSHGEATLVLISSSYHLSRFQTASSAKALH